MIHPPIAKAPSAQKIAQIAESHTHQGILVSQFDDFSVGTSVEALEVLFEGAGVSSFAVCFNTVGTRRESGSAARANGRVGSEFECCIH